jgi:hypothetical protein
VIRQADADGAAQPDRIAELVLPDMHQLMLLCTP